MMMIVKALSLKAARSLEIKTDEGTWMSLDVHRTGIK